MSSALNLLPNQGRQRLPCCFEELNKLRKFSMSGARNTMGIVLRRTLVLFLLSAILSSLAIVKLYDVRYPGMFFTKTPFFYLLNIQKPFEFITDFYGLKYKGHSNEYIDASVLVLGAFEKSTLFLLRDIIKELAPEGGVFVDVGANVGQHSLFMSKFSTVVHAFDPCQSVLARLQDNIALNRIGNIKVHPVGLGAQDEELPFYGPPGGNHGQGSFINHNDSSEVTVDKLQIVKGDEYFENHSIKHVDLMKIDVEGFEKLVLKGLVRTLQRDLPVVVMELNIGEGVLFHNVAEVKRAFPDGYQFYMYDQMTDSHSEIYELQHLEDDLVRQVGIVAFPSAKAHAVRLTNHPNELVGKLPH